MFKFIKRLFTKKPLGMFNKTQLKSIENRLKSISNELDKESKNSTSKIFIQSCKSMKRTIQTALDNLNDIEEVQNEFGDGLQDFDTFNENKV